MQPNICVLLFFFCSIALAQQLFVVKNIETQSFTLELQDVSIGTVQCTYCFDTNSICQEWDQGMGTIALTAIRKSVWVTAVANTLYSVVCSTATTNRTEHQVFYTAVPPLQNIVVDDMDANFTVVCWSEPPTYSPNFPPTLNYSVCLGTNCNVQTVSVVDRPCINITEILPNRYYNATIFVDHLWLPTYKTQAQTISFVTLPEIPRVYKFNMTRIYLGDNSNTMQIDFGVNSFSNWTWVELCDPQHTLQCHRLGANNSFLSLFPPRALRPYLVVSSIGFTGLLSEEYRYFYFTDATETVPNRILNIDYDVSKTTSTSLGIRILHTSGSTNNVRHVVYLNGEVRHDVFAQEMDDAYYYTLHFLRPFTLYSIFFVAEFHTGTSSATNDTIQLAWSTAPLPPRLSYILNEQAQSVAVTCSSPPQGNSTLTFLLCLRSNNEMPNCKQEAIAQENSAPIIFYALKPATNYTIDCHLRNKQAFITTQRAFLSFVTAPKAPFNFFADTVGITQVVLKWTLPNMNDASSGVVQLQYYPSNSPSKIQTIHFSTQNVSTLAQQETTVEYKLSNLQEGTVYTARLFLDALFINNTRKTSNNVTIQFATATSTVDTFGISGKIALGVVIPIAILCCLCCCLLLLLLCICIVVKKRHPKVVNNIGPRVNANTTGRLVLLPQEPSISNAGLNSISTQPSETLGLLNSSLHAYTTNYDINFNSLDFSNAKILGSGGQGTVLTAVYFGTPVAVKFFSKSLFGTNETEQKAFYNEAKFLAQHSNFSNIIRFFGIAEDAKQGRFAIVTELCEGGNLANYIDKVIIAFDEKVQILYGIACGMMYLHSQGIIHRDLKCENVLLDSKKTPKIIDFGISRQITAKQSTNMTANVGTALYIAPEAIALELKPNEMTPSVPSSTPPISTSGTTEQVVSNSGTSAEVISGTSTSSQKMHYDKKLDVYSFAMIMYILYTNNTRPYGTNVTAFQIMHQLSKNPHRRPPIPTSVPKIEQWYIELMKRCWKTNPDRRPDFEQISLELQLHLVK